MCQGSYPLTIMVIQPNKPVIKNDVLLSKTLVNYARKLSLLCYRKTEVYCYCISVILHKPPFGILIFRIKVFRTEPLVHCTKPVIWQFLFLCHCVLFIYPVVASSKCMCIRNMEIPSPWLFEEEYCTKLCPGDNSQICGHRQQKWWSIHEVVASGVYLGKARGR